MNNLAKRIYSSIIVLLFVVLSLLLPIFWFDVLMACLLAAASLEWIHLSKERNSLVNIAYGCSCCLLYIAGLIFFSSWIFFISLFWWSLAFILLCSYALKPIPGQPLPRYLHLLFGIFTLVPAFIALVQLRSYGTEYIVMLLLWVWLTDIGGYIFGNLFGKHRLIAAVSPGKTIEGVLGGLVLVFLLTLALHCFYPLVPYTLLTLLPVAFLISGVAIVGDLFESMLKRRYAVKDSGSALPGHGGILDRIDSLTAAAPILVVVLLYLPFN